MPYINVMLEKGTTVAQRQAFCVEVTRAVAVDFALPPRAVRILFEEFGPEHVSFAGSLKSQPEYHAMAAELARSGDPYGIPSKPLIHVYTEGKSDAQLGTAARDITDAAAKYLDVPPLAIEIIFHMMEPNRVAAGGLLQSSPQYTARQEEARARYGQDSRN